MAFERRGIALKGYLASLAHEAVPFLAQQQDMAGVQLDIAQPYASEIVELKDKLNRQGIQINQLVERNSTLEAEKAQYTGKQYYGGTPPSLSAYSGPFEDRAYMGIQSYYPADIGGFELSLCDHGDFSLI